MSEPTQLLLDTPCLFVFILNMLQTLAQQTVRKHPNHASPLAIVALRVGSAQCRSKHWRKCGNVWQMELSNTAALDACVRSCSAQALL